MSLAAIDDAADAVPVSWVAAVHQDDHPDELPVIWASKEVAFCSKAGASSIFCDSLTGFQEGLLDSTC